MVKTKFNYEFSFGGKTFELSVPLEKVMGVDVKESAHRIINFHNIPVCFHEDLSEKLKGYLKKTKLALEDEIGDGLIAMNINVEEAVEAISQQYIMGHHGYGNNDVPSNDEIFADAYHDLIHSPHYSSLLSMEGEHAVEMGRLLKERDHTIQKVHDTCQQSMQLAVDNIGVLYTDEQVNQLAKQHIEATELELSKWKSSISSLRDEQRKDFRKQVMTMFEASKIQLTSEQQQQQPNNNLQEGKTKLQQQLENTQQDRQQQQVSQHKYKPQQRNIHQKTSSQQHNSPKQQHNSPKQQQNSPKQQYNKQQQTKTWISSRREDSFTVHLGAQMKTTHNLRLISCATFDLCTPSNSDPGQRFQTAITLYSERLCGMVLLVDGGFNHPSGVTKEFSRVCERCTDFHFQDLNEQLDAIKQVINNNKQQTSTSTATKAEASAKLSAGEMYITRHSNLSDIHVVFHVVADYTLHADITSRHPVLLAYRNVVKTAFKNDIRTLTLPLLLVHEMNEDMTIGWCLRRAELVLKCLKGFVMEMASSEASFNVQLVVPPSLSNDTFDNIAAMIPSIFRMSNPLVAKSQ